MTAARARPGIGVPPIEAAGKGRRTIDLLGMGLVERVSNAVAQSYCKAKD